MNGCLSRRHERGETKRLRVVYITNTVVVVESHGNFVVFCELRVTVHSQ